MLTQLRRGTQPLRPFRVASTAALSVALLFTAACGSSSSSTPSTSSSGGSTSDVPSSAVSAVEKMLAEPEAFEAPGPALTDVASVEGDSVLYIPISLQVPAFQSVLKGMQEAGGEVGVTVEGCDGEFNPGGVASCIGQAIAQDVTAVVLDNVPLVLAGQGVAQLQEAGISILVGQQEAAEGTADLAYLATGGDVAITQMADWVAVDSEGSAKVLVVEQTDSPQQIAFVEEGLLPQFEEVCPDCDVTVIKVSSAQLSKLGTQVSTALLKDPEIDYVVSEFDANVNYILQGLANSPSGDKAKVVSVIGDISSLERVESGQQAFDTVLDYRWAGWALTDQVLRMLTGATPLERSDGPSRSFDASNIDSVEVAQSSFDDQSLWGGDTYSDVYRELWGLS